MPEKRKWQAKGNQQSFDNPQKDKDTNENNRTPSPNRILSILGKPIGLLSRKHSSERQKKKYEEDIQRKNKIQANNQKSSGNSNFGNILNFPKSQSNASRAVTNPKENAKNVVDDPEKQIIKSPTSSLSPKNNIITAPKNNTKSKTSKQLNVSKAVTGVTRTKSNSSIRCVEPKTNVRPNSYKQNTKPKSSSAKSNNYK